MTGAVMGRWGLRVFNEKGLCPKCGGEDIGTSYQRNAHCVHYGEHCAVNENDKLREPECCTPATSEHIHRVCQRCHFMWPEDVVEQAHTQHGGAQ